MSPRDIPFLLLIILVAIAGCILYVVVLLPSGLLCLVLERFGGKRGISAAYSIRHFFDRIDAALDYPFNPNDGNEFDNGGGAWA